MSHFYGSITGSRGTTVTKCGTKSTGIGAHIRAWDHGIKVELTHHEGSGTDTVSVYLTGGSNDSSGRDLIYTAVVENG